MSSIHLAPLIVDVLQLDLDKKENGFFVFTPLTFQSTTPVLNEREGAIGKKVGTY